jgi:predicted RNA-binding Zn ribbon-like protein
MEHLLAVANSYHEPEAREEDTGSPKVWLPAHDHLESPEAAVEFLGRSGVRLNERPQARHLAELQEIRAAARALVDSRRAYERRTARLLERVRFQLDAGGTLRPVRTGWDGFVDGLLVPLVELREHADRLKCCDNEQCQWLFIDHSKNRSRQWCESATCGNRQRVRRFRHRLGAA